MSLTKILLILAAGVSAGFINTMAGGGSLITLPLLIFLGLPAAVANGTNRVALLVENLTAVINFRDKGYFDYKFALLLAGPAVIGSLIGAQIAISISEQLFNQILAVIMFIMLILILWNPAKNIKISKGNRDQKRKLISSFVFFLIGIYGGFMQAGVGIIIIAALSLLTGFSLVKINSLKVFIVAFYILSSLSIFIFNGKINWGIALLLALGNGTGSWLASTLAVEKGEKLVKAILTIVVIIMALYLFYQSF
ncbi:MAG: sulfite exporter TauE/SafE family protein [Halanaerobium sp.]